MMVESDAQQPALDGLAPPKRRKRAAVQRIAAVNNPIAQVVLDVQATHLGRSFDYLVQSRDDETAIPGVLVRVRFGGRLVNGVVWKRTAISETAASSLKFIERVLAPEVLVPQELRDDITDIAEAYGGTRANILRLAVPPRVARIDAEQRFGSCAGFGKTRYRLSQETLAWHEQESEHFSASYEAAQSLKQGIAGNAFAAFILDTLPGALRWASDAAWMMIEALTSGKSVVLVLPDTRSLAEMDIVLETIGMRRFAPGKVEHGGWTGDYVCLGSSMSPAERYRSYGALASGQLRCVIGTRAAMYAPVQGPALFAIVDDGVYQNADGHMPYANARGVQRLRAKNHHGVFAVISFARSVASQWECSVSRSDTSLVTGPSEALRGLPSVVKDSMPWIRWLNREELSRLADPTIGARVPHTAVTVLTKALQSGPVLLSVPYDGVRQVLSCAHCHRRAQCKRCTGPLEPKASGAPQCMWCGAIAVDWHCTYCSSERLQLVRVGAAGTAAELRQLFRHVPQVISTPHQPRGIVEEITNKPQIVIATPGAEPHVRSVVSVSSDGVPVCDAPVHSGYQAVAILDAWTGLYAPGVDARVDTLDTWMRIVSQCQPRSKAGQALLIGEADPICAQSLLTWNSTVLASRELQDRAETGMPPIYATACIWGGRDAVMHTLAQIGAIGGDFSTIGEGDSALPGFLGPVPIPQPRTISARQFEGSDDRVRVLVRVSPEQHDELALRLRTVVGRHVASRDRQELRFQIDPKNLL
jgi:primosomal protein N' (replication factor Y)